LAFRVPPAAADGREEHRRLLRVDRPGRPGTGPPDANSVACRTQLL